MMWSCKHFRDKEDADLWISGRAVEWYRIFVENKAYSIMYRPLRSIRAPR